VEFFSKPLYQAGIIYVKVKTICRQSTDDPIVDSGCC